MVDKHLANVVAKFVAEVGTYRLDPPSHITDLAPRELKVVLDKLVKDGRVTADNGVYRIAHG
jgi:hypothetical protein